MSRNRVVTTHGGQRQIVRPDGAILAADSSTTYSVSDRWFEPGTGKDVSPSEIAALLAPPPKRTLAVMVDVTGMSQREVEDLAAGLERTTDAFDREMTATADQIVDAPISRTLQALAVGLGL